MTGAGRSGKREPAANSASQLNRSLGSSGSCPVVPAGKFPCRLRYWPNNSPSRARRLAALATWNAEGFAADPRGAAGLVETRASAGRFGGGFSVCDRVRLPRPRPKREPQGDDSDGREAEAAPQRPTQASPRKVFALQVPPATVSSAMPTCRREWFGQPREMPPRLRERSASLQAF